MIGSASVSVIRTRQASARLAGTSAYLCMNFKTGSRLSPRSNATAAALRRSSAPSAGTPAGPRRRKVSDSAASHVFHGGGNRRACATAQSRLESRRLSSATRKPASTSVLPAIAGDPQMMLLPRAEIGRQAIHGADQIHDTVEGRLASFPGARLQPLAPNIGLRHLALSRLRVDLRDQRFGQSYRQRLHAASV